MNKVGVFCFFDDGHASLQSDLRIPEVHYSDFSTIFFVGWFDESTTYEEIVQKFVLEHRLPHLADPHLRYNFVLQAFEEYPPVALTAADRELHRSRPRRRLSRPVSFQEGQTLAHTHLPQLVMDESEVRREPHSLRNVLGSLRKVLYCATSIGVKALPVDV